MLGDEQRAGQWLTYTACSQVQQKHWPAEPSVACWEHIYADIIGRTVLGLTIGAAFYRVGAPADEDDYALQWQLVLCTHTRHGKQAGLLACVGQPCIALYSIDKMIQSSSQPLSHSGCPS